MHRLLVKKVDFF